MLTAGWFFYKAKIWAKIRRLDVSSIDRPSWSIFGSVIQNLIVLSITKWVESLMYSISIPRYRLQSGKGYVFTGVCLFTGGRWSVPPPPAHSTPPPTHPPLYLRRLSVQHTGGWSQLGGTSVGVTLARGVNKVTTPDQDHLPPGQGQHSCWYY